MRVLGITAKGLFMLCLPLLLLTASIGGAVNSTWLYQYGFQKYDIATVTGLANSELEKIASELINYFNSAEEYTDVTLVKDNQPFVLFNQREVIHLKDVKGLVWLNYWVLLGTLIYTLTYSGVSLFWRKGRYWRRLAWGVVGGSAVTLALVVILGLGMFVNFDRLFLQFHLVSFANDFWQLDPSKDYLIMLFPQGFWYDATLFGALGTASMAVILGGVGVLYLRRTKGTSPDRCYIK